MDTPRIPGDANTKYLCVVGSRTASAYGKMACEKIIAGLAGYNIVIISGLALGIDSIAHRAALDAGLRTIAIPGSGLNWDVLYPASHEKLAREILSAGGALVSPFLPDFRATPYAFPQRNKIMAGMSHAILVIEAEEKSGTLITARLASEYNRDVGVVPGSIFARQSAGPHLLMRIGATPIRDSADVLDLLGLKPRLDEVAGEKRRNKFDVSPGMFDTLSEIEKRLLSFLGEPRTRDELIELVRLPTSDVSVAISNLEIKGIVQGTGSIITRIAGEK